MSKVCFIAAALLELRDPVSGSVLAEASERIVEAGETIRRETTYVERAGGARHSEVLTTESATGRFAAYRFQSHSGERIEVEMAGDGRLLVRYGEGAGKKPSETTLTPGPRTILGQAIPGLVLERWEELSKGSTVRFELVVPPLLTTVGYRIRRDADRSRAEGDARFVADADNWLVRQFAPELTLTFSDPPNAADRCITELLGPSPVGLDGERHKMVRFVAKDA